MRDGHMAQCEPCIQIKRKRKLKENDKKRERKVKRKKERRRQTVREREGGEKREREKGKRGKEVFRYSLRSTKIKPSVFIGARRKVDPRIASYAWVPKSWSFVKLHEVGNFPTLNIFSLKAM